MNKAFDRRFFLPLGFLFFLGFLGFLGSQNYQHLAAYASLASIASLAFFVFIPRNIAKVPPQYRLASYREIFQALIGKV